MLRIGGAQPRRCCSCLSWPRRGTGRLQQLRQIPAHHGVVVPQGSDAGCILFLHKLGSRRDGDHGVRKGWFNHGGDVTFIMEVRGQHLAEDFFQNREAYH